MIVVASIVVSPDDLAADLAVSAKSVLNFLVDCLNGFKLKIGDDRLNGLKPNIVDNDE